MYCHSWDMATVRTAPNAIQQSAAAMTLRNPYRAMSAAENGPMNPYRRMFTVDASDTCAADQPKESFRLGMRTPGADRKPAAPTSTNTVAAATTQA
jgi:hypothetical protein